MVGKKTKRQKGYKRETRIVKDEEDCHGLLQITDKNLGRSFKVNSPWQLSSKEMALQIDEPIKYMMNLF